MELVFGEYLALSMFAAFILLILTGYPIAWVLCGLSIVYSVISVSLMSWTTLMDDTFFVVDWPFASQLVERNWAVMENWVLVALPMFVFMGQFLDKSGIAQELMVNLSRLFGRVKGGLAVSVALIGILLAASTGIIGASVVLLTLMGVPAMLKAGYDKRFATGTVCAVGTLGILIPPSIMLMLMAERMSVPVGDLFMGAMFPGLLLGSFYVALIFGWAYLREGAAPAMNDLDTFSLKDVIVTIRAMLAPILLIFAVLGSIFFGVATPTEASGVGAAAAVLIALAKRRFSFNVLKNVAIETTKTCGFIFALVIGAGAFALIFRGLGGDEVVKMAMESVPVTTEVLVIYILVFTFLLGFFLDWLEISLILLPLVAPVLAGMEVDLIWFGVLFALCLQTSFITPPVGPALFLAQGVVPKGVLLKDLIRGVVPFVIIQLIALAVVFEFPALVTWLPSVAYG